MRTIRLGFSIRFIALAITARLLQMPALLAQTFGERPLKFERLSVAQELSQSGVSCILQDRQGFMWFGTGDGLNKYDGYSFTIYKHEAADSTSLSADWILSIYEDRSGTLWIGTYSGGLNQFDYPDFPLERFNGKSGQFRHYTERDGLPNNAIWGILDDDHGRLWLSTNNGLSRQSFDE